LHVRPFPDLNTKLIIIDMIILEVNLVYHVGEVRWRLATIATSSICWRSRGSLARDSWL